MELQTARREELIQLIVERQGQIAVLQEEIAILREKLAEQEDASSSAATPPRVKPNRPEKGKKPRQKRSRGYGRKRSHPTRRVVHAVEQCRRCGCTLHGGSVKRTREVLHIPIAPVEVVEHVFLERRCPICSQREVPGAEVLRGEVLGQHRVSLPTMALIATLREECRMPIGVLQWLLQAVFGLELSQGEIIAILDAVAKQGRERVAALREALRSSPVVHGDETTWREDGQNGYFWSFSTPQLCYFAYRYSRSGQVVRDIMGNSPSVTLVSDFYGAYNGHPGPNQRCWAHLLRAIHELKERYPEDEALQAWGQAVHALYLEACACRERLRGAPFVERYWAAQRFEAQLIELCTPFLEEEVPQRVLCQRCQRFRKQLFRFVLDPRVPPDNNAAERAIRPIAVSRKISGGTRSPKGSETKGILSSLFGTWRLQGLNPLVACRQLLISPTI